MIFNRRAFYFSIALAALGLLFIAISYAGANDRRHYHPMGQDGYYPMGRYVYPQGVYVYPPGVYPPAVYYAPGYQAYPGYVANPRVIRIPDECWKPAVNGDGSPILHPDGSQVRVYNCN